MDHHDGFLGTGPAADPTGGLAAGVMRKFAAPAKVLDADPGDLFGPPKVASNFADPGYQYPVHTPAAAWVSAAVYHQAGSDDPEVAERIKAACDDHRLWGEWDRLKAAAAPPPPPEPAWALPAVKKYPLGTAADVKQAATYFVTYADRLSTADRRTFAAETVKAAAAQAATLDPAVRDRLEAEAGLGYPAPPAAWRAECEKRAYMVKDTNGKLAETLTKLAASYLDGVPVTEDPVEAAATLRELDKVAGLDLTDPLRGLVAETPSSARAKLASAVRAASGNWYSLKDLDRVPDQTAAELRPGPVVWSKEAKARLLEDGPTAGVFEQILVDHGAEPVARAPRPRVDWASLATG